MSPAQVTAEPHLLAIKAGKVLKCPLVHPPPAQKKRPTQPLPSPPLRAAPHAAHAPAVVRPRRSSTLAAISTWAAHVQPGSPASLSPRSPRRRPSLCRGRRPSIVSIRTTSASFLNIAVTPTASHSTPSIADFKPDLTAVGYTSVFLRFPTSPAPATAPIPLRSAPLKATKTPKIIPVLPTHPPARNPRILQHLRSLATLRSRAKSKPACLPSPTKMKPKTAAAAAATMKRKRAKYATRPPPLANELALMQFADGGSMNHNAKRVMHAQAKASGAMGVGDVHRDGKGGIWWDQDEEWEYAHLLAHGDTGTHDAGELHWVTFDGQSSPSTGPNGEERRGSLSTQDSDLDPRYIVQPVDHLETDDLVTFGSALAPLASRKPAMSLLALPSRPRRAAKHLHKPDYLVDAAFPRIPPSPRSPKSPRSAKFGSPAFVSAGVAKPKGRARRRPAPLKLLPPSPAFKKPTNSPIEADRSRQEFLSSSFDPVTPTPGTAVNVVDANARMTNLGSSESTLSLPLKRTLGKKPSMLNMMGLFKPPRKVGVQRIAH